MFGDLRLLTPPPDLPPAAAKLYVLRCTLPLIAAVMHAFQAVAFWVIGLPRLGLLSVGSVILFAIAVSLIRRGRARAGIWIAYAEAGCHVPLLSIVLGPEAGYAMYAFPLASVAFLVTTPDQRVDRVLMIGYAAALAVLLAWHGDHYEGLVEAPALSFIFYMNVAGVLFAIVAITAWFAKTTAAAEALVEQERARAEGLLRNVLPAPIAERLKRDPGTIAERFDDVTVLFADLVGFTVLSAGSPPERVVELLDELFVAFDALADRHGLEKIKTIGDAYLVVGGLPSPHDDALGAICEMALDMRQAVRDWSARTGRPLQIRIGVHAGPVVAGVIGRRKFAYDLWGDTVNTASRMESHGEPDRIHLSEAIAARLGDRFHVDDRGTIEVKGKGPMRTCWLVDRAEATDLAVRGVEAAMAAAERG